MNKTKFLAMALIVAMSLVGAGYALWGDSIHVYGSISTGTAILDVKNASIELDHKTITECLTGDVWIEGKAVNVEIGNMYPSAQARVKFEIHNEGTLALSIDDVTVDLSNVPEEILYKGRNGVSIRVWDSTEKILFGKSGYVGLDKMEAELERILEGQILNRDDYFVVRLVFEMHPSASVNQDTMQGKDYDFTIDFNFKQPAK